MQYRSTATLSVALLVALISPIEAFCQDNGWVTTLGGEREDRAVDAVAAGDGSIYVTGQANGREQGTTFWRDVFVARLDIAGEHLWTTTVGGSENDVVFGMALGAGDDVRIVGSFSEDATSNGTSIGAPSRGFSVIAVRSTGAIRWSASAEGSFPDTIPIAIATGGTGLTYIAGGPVEFLSFDGHEVGEGGFLAALNHEGGWEWTKSLSYAPVDVAASGENLTVVSKDSVYRYVGGTLQWADEAPEKLYDVKHLVAHEDGGITLGGAFVFEPGVREISPIVRLDATGSTEWAAEWKPDVDLEDEIDYLTADEEGSVYFGEFYRGGVQLGNIRLSNDRHWIIDCECPSDGLPVYPWTRYVAKLSAEGQYVWAAGAPETLPYEKIGEPPYSSTGSTSRAIAASTLGVFIVGDFQTPFELNGETYDPAGAGEVYVIGLKNRRLGRSWLRSIGLYPAYEPAPQYTMPFAWTVVPEAAQYQLQVWEGDSEYGDTVFSEDLIVLDTLLDVSLVHLEGDGHFVHYCQTLGGLKPSPSGESFSIGFGCAVVFVHEGISAWRPQRFRDPCALGLDDEVPQAGAAGGGWGSGARADSSGLQEA